MVSQTDKEFLANIGGRTVDGQKQPDLGEKTPSLADKLLTAQEKAAEAAITMKTLGIGTGGEVAPAHAPTESIDTKIIKDTLSMQKDALKSMADARKLTEESLHKAETAKNEALAKLYSHQLDTIRDAEARARAIIEQSQGITPPKNPFDTYREIKAIVDELKEDVPKPTPSGVSDEVQIRLKQMELDYQRQLAQMQAENMRLQREWEIRMLEFKENQDQRKIEYQDKKRFREEGLASLQDLISSIGSGITKERGGNSPIATQATQGEELPIQTKVTKFPCQFCQSPITVATGATHVVCPNEKCAAEFDIDLGEGNHTELPPVASQTFGEGTGESGH